MISSILDMFLLTVAPGPEMAERLKSLCPNARVLFTSGYPQGHLGQQPMLKRPFLRKPYDAALLTAKVGETLAMPVPTDSG